MYVLLHMLWEYRPSGCTQVVAPDVTYLYVPDLVWTGNHVWVLLISAAAAQSLCASQARAEYILQAVSWNSAAPQL
jgi:hypothetical protein